jgi:hypothetical protein
MLLLVGCSMPGFSSRQQLLQCRPLHACIRRHSARHNHQQPLRRDTTPTRGVINTEVSAADSWALTNRAALLGLKVEQLNEYLQSHPDHAWMAVCEPEREWSRSTQPGPTWRVCVGVWTVLLLWPPKTKRG